MAPDDADGDEYESDEVNDYPAPVYGDSFFDIDYGILIQLEDPDIATDHPIDPDDTVASRHCYIKKGLTWGHVKHICKSNVDHVNCHTNYGGVYESCNPYVGDTKCYLYRPILCINKSNIPRPGYSFSGNAFYHGWTEGIIRLSKFYRGCDLLSKENADKLCVTEFGCGYEMASHHDGLFLPSMTSTSHIGLDWINAGPKSTGGWTHYSIGNIFNIIHEDQEVKKTRFWMYIRDQPHGNCWNPIP